MKGLLKRLWKQERGQDIPEYALLLVLICLSLVTAVSALGMAVNKTFTNAPANLSAPTTTFQSYPSSSDTGSGSSFKSASGSGPGSSGQNRDAGHGRGNSRD